jgi:hypothetical protein
MRFLMHFMQTSVIKKRTEVMNHVVDTEPDIVSVGSVCFMIAYKATPDQMPGRAISTSGATGKTLVV